MAHAYSIKTNLKNKPNLNFVNGIPQMFVHLWLGNQWLVLCHDEILCLFHYCYQLYSLNYGMKRKQQ